MFDDLIIPKKGMDIEICVYDVVDRIREQTDTLMKKLGGLSGMIQQPSKNLQIDVLKKVLKGSVELLDVVQVKTFFVTPINNTTAKLLSPLFPYGTSTLTCKEYKSSSCNLPTGNIKSLYIYSWMKFANGQYNLTFAECFNRVYAVKTALYKKK